jgi:O-6-methylguanine DNA methyltransferase
MGQVFYDGFTTAIGVTWAVWNSTGLLLTSFPDTSEQGLLREIKERFGVVSIRRRALPAQMQGLLRRYFSGEKVNLSSLPLDLTQGTAFQRAVWKKLIEIPYGEVRSYGWVAREVGRPRAVRAVGRACGQNPLPPVIPCHRVVGSNGALTGYSGNGGISLKKRLLELEGAGLPLGEAVRSC